MTLFAPSPPPRGRGLGSVQLSALAATTFFARLTGPSWGRPNSYYFFRPEEERSAHCRLPMSCPPDVICQMPDARRLRTAGVSALRACAYYGPGNIFLSDSQRGILGNLEKQAFSLMNHKGFTKESLRDNCMFTKDLLRIH